MIFQSVFLCCFLHQAEAKSKRQPTKRSAKAKPDKMEGERILSVSTGLCLCRLWCTVPGVHNLNVSRVVTTLLKYGRKEGRKEGAGWGAGNGMGSFLSRVKSRARVVWRKTG